MPADVTREEFHALEQEVEGEKLVTRHILEQARRNGDDLAAVKTDLTAVKTRIDRVEHKVDDVAQELGGVKHTLNGLVRDLPRIIAEALRGHKG